MSVYNFNHNNNNNHEQINRSSNSHAAESNHHYHNHTNGNSINNNNNDNRNGTMLSNSNGTTRMVVARYQGGIENDYIATGRNNHHSSTNSSSNNNSNNNLDMGLTRPTSKTAMMVRQRRAMLEQLSCFICKGYLIDATTIDECMDSFCKSCIVIYLRNHNDCPKCGIHINKTNPLSNIRSDKVLQDIVYKLVPGLYDNEMKRRREFYKNLYGVSSSEDDEDDSTGSGSRSTNLVGEQYGVITHPKTFYKPTDSIDLSIEPQTRNDSSSIYYDNKRQSIVTCFTGNVHIGSQNFSAVDSQQFKTYLRCPAKLTTLQLKKFIAAKFNICKDDTLHLLYLNESLKDKYSLIDIAYIYDWRGIEHMRLFYIIERDLTNKVEDTKQFVDGLSQNSTATTTTKTRQSVGTSTTPPVKRVCIDPHPKFYSVPTSNTNDDDDDDEEPAGGGRVMRSRVNESASQTIGNNRINLPPLLHQAPKQPILRSSSSSGSNQRSCVDSQQQTTTSNNDVNETVMNFVGRHQQAPQSRFSNTVTSDDEQSNNNLRQQNDKDSATIETRSTKRQTTVATGSSSTLPKIYINLNTYDHRGLTQNNTSTVDKNFTTTSTFSKHEPELEIRGKEIVVSQGASKDFRQMTIPNMRKANFSTTTTTTATTSAGFNFGNITCPTQSSLVTLASFTQTRGEQVVAMSSSSTATISSNYKNVLNSVGSLSKTEIQKSDLRQTNIINQTANLMKPTSSNVTPQLAFSFVTERGITIRMNNSNQGDGGGSGTLMKQQVSSNNQTNQTLASSTQNQLAIVQARSSAINNNNNNNSHTTTTNQQSQQINTSGPSSNSSQSSHGNDSAPSSRHHIKVKPVYKTFVDPTKLKFKKL